MTELLTAAQMRTIEQAAIASGEVTGLELMERAGRGVVEAVLEEWPEMAKAPQRVVVLCGPGNNGGDGFVVARLLKERGWEVEVFLYGEKAKLPADAAENYRRWRELGEVLPIVKETGRQIHRTSANIVIDAIFGTGLTRRMPSEVEEMISDLHMYEYAVGGPRVVSVDVPSGLCSNSGRILGGTVTADLTVTFEWKKTGHMLGEGPRRCGVLISRSIGLEEYKNRIGLETLMEAGRANLLRSEESGTVGWVLKRPEQAIVNMGYQKPDWAVAHVQIVSDVHALTHWFPRSSYNHKYDHGHALILSGGVGKGGAARLAARGALRIGAGLVTVGCPPEALIENAARLDAVMVRSVKGAEGLGEVLEDKRLNALCLGPGMGRGERTREMVRVVLAAKRKVVLDADGLTSFQDNPVELFEMLHENVVLTPHAGEFARIFPDIAERLAEPAVTGPAYSKVDATREAAERAGCVVLFKGADTVIAGSGGQCSINSAHYDRAAPWLATAGSGDVLAGFITGLLARGFAPMQAAETAAWLHVECARAFGPGLIAEDLAEQLPGVFRELGV